MDIQPLCLPNQNRSVPSGPEIHKCIDQDPQLSLSCCALLRAPVFDRDTQPAVDSASKPSQLAGYVLSSDDIGWAICVALGSPDNIARVASVFRGVSNIVEKTCKDLCKRQYKRQQPAVPKSWLSLTGHLHGTVVGEKLGSHDEPVVTMAALTGGRFASGGKDGTIRVWDVDTGCKWAMQAHEKTVGLLIHVGGSHLLSGCHGGILHILDTDQAQTIARMDAEARVQCVVVLGQWIVAGGEDSQIRVWDMHGSHICTVHWDVGGVTSLSQLNANQLIAGAEDGSLWLWSIQPETGELYHGQPWCDGHQEAVWCIRMLSDQTILSASDDETVKIWDKNHELINSLNLSDNDGWGDLTLSYMLELRDEMLALGTLEGQIQVWNVGTQPAERLHVLRGHTKMIHALHELQDGRIVSASRDGTLRIWHRTGQCDHVLEMHNSAVTSVIELADGRLVSGSTDGQIILWE